MVPINKKTFNPFPGLRPFAPEESDLFFGRKGESEEVLEKLLRNKFVTVMGASGTGKSSLIFCGVLPNLRKKSGEWKIITFRPGNEPFENLSKAACHDRKDFFFRGMLARFELDRGDRLGESARHDQFEAIQVGGHVEGETVRADAARYVNANRGNLALRHRPDPG